MKFLGIIRYLSAFLILVFPGKTLASDEEVWQAIFNSLPAEKEIKNGMQQQGKLYNAHLVYTVRTRDGRNGIFRQNDNVDLKIQSDVLPDLTFAGTKRELVAWSKANKSSLFKAIFGNAPDVSTSGSSSTQTMTQAAFMSPAYAAPTSVTRTASAAPTSSPAMTAAPAPAASPSAPAASPSSPAPVADAGTASTASADASSGSASSSDLAVSSAPSDSAPAETSGGETSSTVSSSAESSDGGAATDTASTDTDSADTGSTDAGSGDQGAGEGDVADSGASDSDSESESGSGESSKEHMSFVPISNRDIVVSGQRDSITIGSDTGTGSSGMMAYEWRFGDSRSFSTGFTIPYRQMEMEDNLDTEYKNAAFMPFFKKRWYRMNGVVEWMANATFAVTHMKSKIFTDDTGYVEYGGGTGLRYSHALSPDVIVNAGLLFQGLKKEIPEDFVTDEVRWIAEALNNLPWEYSLIPSVGAVMSFMDGRLTLKGEVFRVHQLQAEVAPGYENQTVVFGMATVAPLSWFSFSVGYKETFELRDVKSQAYIVDFKITW